MTRAGSAEERDPEAEALLHPLREPSDQVVRSIGEADELEDVVEGLAALSPRQAHQVGMQIQDLAGLEPRLVAEELGQVADLAAGREVAERRVENLARASCRPERGRAGA